MPGRAAPGGELSGVEEVSSTRERQTWHLPLGANVVPSHDSSSSNKRRERNSYAAGTVSSNPLEYLARGRRAFKVPIYTMAYCLIPKY